MTECAYATPTSKEPGLVAASFDQRRADWLGAMFWFYPEQVPRIDSSFSATSRAYVCGV